MSKQIKYDFQRVVALATGAAQDIKLAAAKYNV